MVTKDDEVVFFYYPESAFQLRIHWYLKLAGLQYSECLQPAYMPRPDLTALGVSYRRIPILSIGSHVYCDSRLILRVLQSLHPLPHGNLSLSDKGLEALFQSWSIDSGVFRHAANFIPFEHAPLGKDPAFVADRVDYMAPAPFSPKQDRQARPESMEQLRQQCAMLEKTFFADDRFWILGSDKGPSAVDIEAVFPFYLLILVWKADCSVIEERYPRVYAWVMRFHAAVTTAIKSSPPPQKVSGEAVVKRIVAEAATMDFAPEIDETNTLGLVAGQQVEIWPTDSGIHVHQRGELVVLRTDEICVRTDKGVLVHYPRWQFHIQAAA